MFKLTVTVEIPALDRLLAFLQAQANTQATLDLLTAKVLGANERLTNTNTRLNQANASQK
jgi:hypothetical protein